jgi:RHS repeat-associated protein
VYGFTGEQMDPSGLVYLRARYYAPITGRFVSRDPWPGYLWRPQTLNRHAYVANDPLNELDPSGYLPAAFDINSCAAPMCFVFYFPGTGKVDNNYQSYDQPEEKFFIDSLSCSSDPSRGKPCLDGRVGFGADAAHVIFPFGAGNGYPDALKAYMAEAGPFPYGNRAQKVQVNAIINDHFNWLFPIKAQEIGVKIMTDLVASGNLGASVEIDFVAHSGGAHIALNTTRFMPSATGYSVDDVVALGGLFKAFEWKETGSLASVDQFYDILSDLDYVQAVRNGWVFGFNFTAWHARWCDESCLAEQSYTLEDLHCCTPGMELPNAERIHARGGHSDYWTDEGVDVHLRSILCENTR